MPTLWSIDLGEVPNMGHKSYFVALNAIACGFFEKPESDHRAVEKSFAIRLTAGVDAEYGTAARITLCWLDDTATPRVEIPEKIHFGPQQIPVLAHGNRTIPYGAIESARPGRRARFEMTSPTVFRHRDMDWPLPDPYIAFSSLGRRYLALRRGAGPIRDDGLLRELAGSVGILEPDIHPAPFSWHATTTGGFVGSVTFTLKGGASPELVAAFTALSTFANIAGIGHGTTHGLGAVTVTWPQDRG